jgi:beta-lactamase regulating signal transducer with metallopeptidase domain
MEHLMPTILQISGALSGSLLNVIGEGILLAAAVGVCLRLFSGVPASTRFLIWTAALLTLLSLHLLPFVAAGNRTFLSASPSSYRLDARWGLAIVGIWALISVARSLRLLHSIFELRRIARTAEPLTIEPEFTALVKNGARSAELCTSTKVDRPSVVGFFRPKILLPPSLLHRLSSLELQQVLLHEIEHLRRRDDWTNLIQKISLILFPLNPALGWIERQLCIERELACDDCVLANTVTRKSYAVCLTHLAEDSLLSRGVSLALGAWEKKSELTRRVHRILQRPEVHLRPATARIVTAGMLLGLLSGAAELRHTPALVSFSPAQPVPVQTGVSSLSPAEPIIQTDRSGLKPTLVKAVMPEPQQKNLVLHTPRGHKAPAIRQVQQPSRPRPQGWVVLTGWRVVPISSHSALAVSESTDSSYTAVSIENGWLVVQL